MFYDRLMYEIVFINYFCYSLFYLVVVILIFKISILWGNYCCYVYLKICKYYFIKFFKDLMGVLI